MGNYFSSQKGEKEGEKEESIKIINEVDHVHVIVSNSDLKNESHAHAIGGLKNGTVQDISNSNHLQVDSALTKKIDNDLDTLLWCENHDDGQKKKYNDNIFNKTIYKKNIKKRKGKKNKKRHLQ